MNENINTSLTLTLTLVDYITKESHNFNINQEPTINDLKIYILNHIYNDENNENKRYIRLVIMNKQNNQILKFVETEKITNIVPLYELSNIMIIYLHYKKYLNDLKFI